MQLKTLGQPETRVLAHLAVAPRRPPRIVSYLWVIIKNVIGWVFILCSGAVGLVTPGPFGVPMFLIGFALITFPGKRKLTARVLKGKPVPPDSRPFRRWLAGLALSLPAVCAFYLQWKYPVQTHWLVSRHIHLFLFYFF